MKSFIAFCFLAAICAIHASADNPLDQFKDAVDSTKRSVGLTIANLERTRVELIKSTNQNLGTLRRQSMTNIENIVKSALPEIRARVDAAKAEGKDAEHCYITAQNSLHSILGTSFSGLHSCEMNERSQLQQIFASLDTGVATGYAFMHQLDNVFPQCYQPNTPQMQSCITKKLEEINESIRSYKLQVNTLIFNAQNDLNNAIHAVSSCIMGPESAARSATNDLRIAADRCIKN